MDNLINEKAAGGDHAALESEHADSNSIIAKSQTYFDSAEAGKSAQAAEHKPEHFNNEVRMVCMSDIEMQPIYWLWHGRIALGKLTLIAGDPGTGKSQLTASLAATVSRGSCWPDNSSTAPLGSTVFLSAEDDPADTIMPRLLAADADISKCHILQSIHERTQKGNHSERCFDLVRDMERLGRAIGQIGDVKLVIVDPIAAYLGKVDSNDNAEIRGALSLLTDMAAKYRVAVILITHLNKSLNQNIIGRVIGSIGMIAAVRAGYVVTKDEKHPERRYFLPIKSNIGNDRDGFSFEIESITLDTGIPTSRIVWQPGLVNASVLGQTSLPKPTVTSEAMEWLKEILRSKTMLAADIFIAGDDCGFNMATINRAAATMRVVKRKRPVKNGGWEWSLPMDPNAHPVCEDIKDFKADGTEIASNIIDDGTIETMASSISLKSLNEEGIHTQDEFA